MYKLTSVWQVQPSTRHPFSHNQQYWESFYGVYYLRPVPFAML